MTYKDNLTVIECIKQREYIKSKGHACIYLRHTEKMAEYNHKPLYYICKHKF